MQGTDVWSRGLSEAGLTSLTAARRASHLRSLAASRRNGAQPMPDAPPPVRPPATPATAPARPSTLPLPPTGAPPPASSPAAPPGSCSLLKDTHNGACHIAGTRVSLIDLYVHVYLAFLAIATVSTTGSFVGSTAHRATSSDAGNPLGHCNDTALSAGSLQPGCRLCASLQRSTSTRILKRTASERRQPTCGAWTSARCPASRRSLAACHSHRVLVKTGSTGCRCT